MSLYSRFKRQVSKQALVQPGEKLLIAISGGLDSCVLLDLLLRLRAELALEFVLAHVNYRLRGRASEQDEAFVRRLAASQDLTLEVLVAKLASKASLQEKARQIRYSFFAKVAHKHGCSQVAVAHQAQDQVETFFLKMLQGAGLQGLQGMKAQRPLTPASHLQLLRPLLPFTREEVEAYARERGLKWREDASNRKVDYARNFIRLKILPLLKRANPQALHKIAEALETLQGENDWMEAEVEEALKGKLKARAGKISLPLAFLKKHPISFRKRIYVRVFKEVPHLRLTRGYIEGLDEMVMGAKSQMKLSFSGGYGACLEKGHLTILKWRSENLSKRGFFA